jgi:hypothetical protein
MPAIRQIVQPLAVPEQSLQVAPAPNLRLSRKPD